MEGGAADDASSEQGCQKLSLQNAGISGLGFHSSEEDPRGCLSYLLFTLFIMMYYVCMYV